MSADDTSEDDDENADSSSLGVETGPPDVRGRLEQEADRAREQFDENVIDLLSWILDTETRARIYVYLCETPESTSEEVATGTGLYPSTVREALAELHEDGQVTRTKRQSDGAGNNPYEYSAFPPSELVSERVNEVQKQLNTVFNLDTYLEGDSDDSEPVTITVREEHERRPNGNGETADGHDGTADDGGHTDGTGDE